MLKVECDLSLSFSSCVSCNKRNNALLVPATLARLRTYTQKHTPVNEEQSLHQEVDPRYRGSHIPSRAFRILQNFTTTDSSVAEDGKPYVTNGQATSFI